MTGHAKLSTTFDNSQEQGKMVYSNQFDFQKI